MTTIISPALVSNTLEFPLNHARIGWDNLASSVVATSEAAGLVETRFGATYRMIKWALLSMLLISMPAIAQPESYYQDQWCIDKGEAEVVLPDRTRVDCITDEYAVEVDFAHKWAEAIGQALYYAEMTDKKPAVLLIVGPDEHRFVRRFHNAASNLGIHLYTVDK